MHEKSKTSITMAEVEELLSKKNDIINHLNTAAIKQYIEDKSFRYQQGTVYFT